MQDGLKEFLIKSVLDTAFRELAQSDPDAALEGFDLSEDEKHMLIGGDERVLSLLGRVLPHSGAVQHGPEPACERTSEPSSYSPQTLPEINLRMRLVPHAVASPDDQVELSYSASLHPWTDDPASWDQPVGGAAEAASTAAAVDFKIRVVPTMIPLPGSEPKLAYSATIQSPEEKVRTVALTGETESGDPSPRPPPYHGDSLAARQAAAEVLQAEPNQRYPKLLQLISALRRGDDDA